MVPLLAALAFQVSRPVWAVAEFRDLKAAHSGYGKVAAADVASELTKIGTYDVLSGEAIARSATALGSSPSSDRIDALQRIAVDLQTSTFVSGEVIEYRTLKVKGGRQAEVALRVLVYDTATGQVVNGTMEKGESVFVDRRVSDAELISEALQQAAAIAVRTLRGQTLPTGTIIEGRGGYPVIDQGARAGFRLGDRVTVSRGAILIEFGRVVLCDPDRAEVALEGVFTSFAPGDRVRAVYVPSPLPHKGESVFTDVSERAVRRRPWWRWW